ncbi:MAG: toxin-antitoxin system YwqK family antitoxin [Flavobacteriales bacterium]
MKHILFLTFFALFITSFSSSAQTQDFLDSQLKSSEKSEAKFKRTFSHIGDSVFVARVVDLKDNLKIEGAYLMEGGKLMENGEFTFYYPNGNVESKGMYSLGVKVGNWRRYTQDGKPKADRYYNPESVELIRAAMGS